MTYLEFVDRLLRVTVETVASAPNSSLVGVDDIARALGVSAAGQSVDDDLVTVVWTGLEDLEALGLVQVENRYQVTIRQEARKVRHGGSLRDLWPSLTAIFLEPDQEAFLQATVKLSERPSDGWATVEFIPAADVVGELGWDDDVAVRYSFSTVLEDLGLARVMAAMGGHVDLRPTYRGVVRATEQQQTKWQVALRDLLERGETANVEFKRQLALDTDTLKAEFVRDVCALANASVSGSRYLVIGFEPLELRFFESISPNITQDRIEDVLNAWTIHAPPADLHLVDVTGGRVGVLEVGREPAHLPYLPSRSFGKILRREQVLVRHGSHVAAANDEEIADLEREAARARRPAAPDG